MADFNTRQITFTAGELSPRLQSRSDLQQYSNSAEILQNAIVSLQGNVYKRPGTTFVQEVKDSTKNTRLIKFEYSNTDAYQIEMGAGYFRFFRGAPTNAAIVASQSLTNGSLTSNITGWTTDISGTGAAAWDAANGGSAKLSGGAAGRGGIYQAITFPTTATSTVTFSTFSNTVKYSVGLTPTGTTIASGSVTPGAAHTFTFAVSNTFSSYAPFPSSATDSNVFTIYLRFYNDANNDAYVNAISINQPLYQINNPFLNAEIDDVDFVQSYDTLYFFHKNWPPFILVRLGHNQWVNTFLQYASTISSLQTLSFNADHSVYQPSFLDGPYYDITDKQYGGIGSDITIDPSGNGPGAVTLVASAALFQSTDVGRHIRYRASNNAQSWGWAIITAYTNSTTVTARVQPITTTVAGVTTDDVGFAANTASRQWKLGYWSATTGFPATATIHQQRFVLGNTTTKQQTTWFSRPADLYNMKYDDSAYRDAVDANCGMTYTIADNKANVIEWILPRKHLFLGTSGGIWTVNTQDSSTAISPSNIAISPTINVATSSYNAIAARTALLFTQFYGTKLLEISYRVQDDNFITTDLAQLADHRTKDGLKWLALQSQPEYVVWANDQEGGLSSLTYHREQNIIAWCRHVLGGTDVEVKSISSISGDVEDQVWMIVSRTINGQTKQYVEYLSPTFLEQDIEEARFLDCAGEYSGSPTTTITGLTWLVGEDVTVFGDGAVVARDVTVNGSGEITFDQEVSEAIVGLPYDYVLKTNPLTPEYSSIPNAQGKIGRPYKAVLHVYRSYGGEIGQDADHLDVMPYYNSQTQMGDPLTLVTDVMDYRIDGNMEYLPRLYIKHSDPLPFNLIGVTIDSSFNTR